MNLQRRRHRIVDPTSCSPPHKWGGGVGDAPATSPLTPLRSRRGEAAAIRPVATRVGTTMLISIAGAVAFWLLLYPLEALARVGGGGSYSGGGGGGSSGGGGGGGGGIGIVRILLWGPIEDSAGGVLGDNTGVVFSGYRRAGRS